MSNRTRDGRKFGEVGRVIVAVLQEHGIRGYTFDKAGKHPAVTFELRGAEVSFRFPSTPKDATMTARTIRKELIGLILDEQSGDRFGRIVRKPG